jgi:hypothetical protein
MLYSPRQRGADVWVWREDWSLIHLATRQQLRKDQVADEVSPYIFETSGGLCCVAILEKRCFVGFSSLAAVRRLSAKYIP